MTVDLSVTFLSFPLSQRLAGSFPFPIGCVGKDVVLQDLFTTDDLNDRFRDHFLHGGTPLILWWQLDAVFVVVVHLESAVCFSAFDGGAEIVTFVVKFLDFGKDVLLQGDLGATFATGAINDCFRDHLFVSFFTL